MSNKNNHSDAWQSSQEHIYAAVYAHENQAIRTIEYLIQKDFLMDRISIIGKRLSKGDDILGIYYPSPKERMKVWAKRGVIIGAVWGLIASFISMIASLEGSNQENLVQAYVWTIAYSAMVGGIMAAAAGFSQIANMLHRMGIPQHQLKQLEAAIKADKYVILLLGSRDELEPFRYKVEHSGAELFLEFAKDKLEI